MRINASKLKELLVLIDKFGIIDKIAQFYIEQILGELKINLMIESKSYEEIKS